MAQDAELKLKVSLDLAFFRQQISTISTQLAGQGIDISAKIDGDDVIKQYKSLAKTLESKTIRLKVESATLDSLVTKAANLKKSLEEFGGKKISLGVEIADNIDELRKNIKSKLPAIKIGISLEEPVNVDNFIRDVAKKVKDQTERSYVAGGIPIATKLALPGITEPLNALQKNLNRQDPLKAKVGTRPSIFKADVTAFQAAVNEKFKNISVKVRAEIDAASAAAAQTPTAGSSRTFLQELKGLDKGVLQSIYRAAGEDALLAFDEGITNNKASMIQALRDAAKDASDGFLAALENKKSALFKAAGEYAGALLGGLKKELKIQSPSREMFDIGDDAGKGFELGLLKAMQLAEKSATNQMRRMLDRLARMALMMGGMSAEQINRQVAQARALPGLNFPATVPPRQRIPIGPSETGRALPAGRAAAGMIGAAQAPVGLLPSITRRSSIQAGIENIFAAGGPRFPEGVPGKLALSTEALQERVNAQLAEYFKVVEAKVREVFNPQDLKRALNIFSYLPQALRDAEARTRQARVGIPSAQGIAGLLPAAQGRAPSTYSTGAIGGESREQMMARRTAEAYARSALRGMDVMGGGAGRPPSPYSYAYRSARPTSAIVPYAAGGAMVPTGVAASGGGAIPPGGGGGGTGGMGGLGGFGRAIGGINLPGSGVIRELGSEFAFATKQVLLFGQAYKMLAFIQNFPAQVGAAVSQLQNFRNTLGAISPTAEEAAASNQLILDLVERYNVPLQSARDGFTKLYASMAPAGFNGDEIRDLFTGITQAAATFGMSADKVDRVNYAFAQMASKGQVMSEELKGQLGDVLPGAMALFAEAAGFEGPKAIQDFSQALEDGAYKGEAMVALLKNVGVIMQQEFGPGAEGAARTFQGVINRMQNSMVLLYESFEPVAINFLNGVVVPLTSGIKEISDGFKSFFTGMTAQTTGGFAIAQELERLRPAFDGIRQNAALLIEQFGQFARIGLEVSKVLLQIAGNPFVGYVARVYINVLALTTAIQLLNLRALIPMVANLARSAYALIGFTVQCVRAGQSAQVMGLMVKTAGITLRTFFASTGVGIVIVGISMLIERFMTMNQALEDTRAKALGAANAIRSMSQTEARIEEQQRQSGVRLLERLSVRKGVDYRKTGTSAATNMVQVSEQELAQLEALGIPVQKSPVPGIKGGMISRQAIAGNIQQQQDLMREAQYRQTQLRSDENRARQAAILAPIPPSEGDGGTSRSKELDTYNRSQLDFIQKQFELEKQSLDKRLQGELISQTQYDIALAELKLESEKLRIAEEYRLAVDKTNADNLSASDKVLKLKDLEIIKNKELAIAEDDRNIAIGAARKKIIDPIIDEIDNETLAIERQAMEAKNLAEGRLNLSAAQEAELSVKERYASLSQDERENAKGELDILRQIREQRLRNAEALRLQVSLQEKINETRGIGGGLRSGFFGQAAGAFERAMLESDGNVDYATQMANIETTAMQLRSVFEGLQSAIGGVSEAFANMLTEGIVGMISGTATAKEVFASFLQSVGQALSQAASQMIATYIAIGIAKMFAGLGGGGGGGKGGLDTSGFTQYPMLEGPGFTPFANGGIALGGFQAFANGGVVTGPTLGLVGEGKYNEAVVPLPDGRSIPVQLGGRSARDMMGSNAPGMPQAPSLSMKFETTKINGVEYVSREQLEQAMAETRRASIAGGAQRGMSMTLDKIKQSPSTRSSIGIR